MAEIKVKDVMSKQVLTILKGTSVKEVARILTKKGVGGAPVVDEKGNLIGIVSESDLIMQDVKVHFPTYISFLDGFIYLESLKRFEENLRKAVGAKVEDVMTEKVVTVDADETIEEAATLLADRRLSRAPVLSQGKMVGIISKADIVKAIGRS